MGESSSTHDIKADDSEFQKVIKNVIGTLQGLKNQMDSVGKYAKEMLTVGVFGFSIASFIKGAEEMEQSIMTFHNALEANGVALDQWGEHLDSVVDHIAMVSTHNAEEVRKIMESALSRGVGADQLENMSKMAIGLNRVTSGHIGLEAAMRMITMAQEGNYRSLIRQFPELRRVHNAQEAMNVIYEKAKIGLQEEGKALDTTAVMQHKLNEALQELKEDLGQALLPSLLEFYRNCRMIVLVMRDWVALNKELVGSIVQWTTTVLTAVVFLPIITRLFFSLGSTMVWLVTSPIGLLITGFATLMAVIAYASGSGDTFASRMYDGFQKVLTYLDEMLGSWNTFKERATAIWEYVAARTKTVWEECYHMIRTATMALGFWLEETWDEIGNKMASKAWAAAKKAQRRIQDPMGLRDKSADARADWNEDTVAELESSEKSVAGKWSRTVASKEGQSKYEELGKRLKEDAKKFNEIKDTAGGHELGLLKDRMKETLSEMNAIVDEERSKWGTATDERITAENKRHKEEMDHLFDETKAAEDKIKVQAKTHVGKNGKPLPTLTNNVSDKIDEIKNGPLGKLYAELQTANKELSGALFGEGLGGLEKPGLSPGVGQQPYKPKFMGAEESYKNIALMFAGGRHVDPAAKTAANTDILAKAAADEKVRQDKIQGIFDHIVKLMEELPGKAAEAVKSIAVPAMPKPAPAIGGG